ncbi:CoxG family protein [Jannaschia formosa]|uniref:CoxG family protein n=1 Tax=Jannaschia formosa TaxID=2259592 RepID=UPI000E1C28B5|nr:carbon monoxide dehydrogenase subunit G [Jannaschia formosa]TFL16674.1 carbon monoxide dehydrogenase [Jannaschia formosa]
MKMTGTRTIAAPPATVYAALLDPEVLRDSIPGCTELTGSAQEGFDAVVTQKVGPVKATFKGRVQIDDQNPPNALHLSGEGKGGPAGFAKGGATVTLAAVAEGTKLDYDVDASVGGKIAQLGARVVDAFAARMADQFFTRFQEKVDGSAAEPAAAASDPAPDPAPVRKPEPAKEPSIHEATSKTPPHAPEPEKKSWLKRIFG